MSPETADYFVNLGERVGRAAGSGAFTLASVAAFAWPFAHLVRFVRAGRGRTARAPRIRWVLLVAFLASFIVELERETTLKLAIDIVEFGLLLLGALGQACVPHSCSALRMTTVTLSPNPSLQRTRQQRRAAELQYR